MKRESATTASSRASIGARYQHRTLAALLGIPNVAGTLLPSGLPLSGWRPERPTSLENFTFKDDMTWVKRHPQLQVRLRPAAYRGRTTTIWERPAATSPSIGAAGLTGNAGRTTIAEHGRHQPGVLHAGLGHIGHFLYSDRELAAPR